MVAVSGDATDIRKAKTGSASWRENGIDTVIGNIREAVDELVPRARGGIGGIALGLPCYGESAEGDIALRAAAGAAFPSVPLHLTNDVEVGWAGSLALAPGINVVAGTGSIAYGKDAAGNAARSGGWDEFFSDEGSGYWLGRKMMQLFSKQADGRVPRGALYGIVRGEFSLGEDLDFIDLIRTRYLGRRESVAGLQILLERAALAGDESARALYREAAGELCALAFAVRDQLDFPPEGFLVSCSGGVFKAGELIAPIFREALERGGARMVAPRCTPAEGAALMAFDRFCPGGVEEVRRGLGVV